ncbi:diguanylate cyclase/phosphodiesterase (GGDEF & EAL domains) with PAS/PAC sensor(s) [Moritella sp. JT01]|uniref:GGDEF domain-containing protein n=1 Tax=Moritella sp. JT01 TaxID=756698 RepID=UPI000792E56D|nr:GGDEF domain-containing protein [Moritella sp. JT01]KXO09317.1 diguanylate cyclase/phosphodiesterase (GGDEF & EAL domains) with PAS/PAC sensor(s) [Moritella sp. JT01]
MPLSILDLFSIAIFTAFGLLFLAIIMVCIWIGNRRYEGVSNWLFASLIILTFAFIIAEELWYLKLDGYSNNAWLNIMFPNILLCFGVCQITHGFHRFLQIKQSLFWLYACQLLIVGPLYAYGLSVETPILFSIIVLTLSVTISLCFNCYYLFSDQGKQYGRTRYICILACVLAMSLNVTRILLLYREPGLMSTIELSTALACINLLMSQCFLTFCYLMFCTQRNAFSLQHMSFIDPLANIYNRRGYQHAIAALAPHKEAAVMILDIDHFKRVNDEYGHATGDLVIKDIAMIIAKECDSTCIYARTGGEEFSIYSPFTSAKAAETTAETVRLTIMKHAVKKQNLSINVTASIGISIGKSVNIFALEEEADKALYQAKREGRNCTVMQLFVA